jgi:hypothetical protein
MSLTPTIDQLYDPETMEPVGGPVPIFSAEGERCLYCGGRTSDPAIQWVGLQHRGQQLDTVYLHPVCAVEFCLGLLRDVQEWKSMSHSKLLAVQLRAGGVR